MRMKWFFVVAALFCGVSVSPAETINVAAAVSLREAITDAATAYQADGGDAVTFTFGASGQLAAQIQNGAPVDVFISAADKQVDDLSKAGLVDDSTRRVIAGNALVLIVPADAKSPPAGFGELAGDSMQKIAIGEPKTVPAGQYAMEVLKALKLEEKVTPRLIFGANVRQVLEYVETGEVTAGMVYSTDATEAGAKVKVVATADPSTHQPIVYPAVVIKNSSKKPAGVKFLDYLGSEKGFAALAARGFTRGATAATNPSAEPAVGAAGGPGK